MCCEQKTEENANEDYCCSGNGSGTESDTGGGSFAAGTLSGSVSGDRI